MHGYLGWAVNVHPTLKGYAVLIGPDTVSAGNVLAARLGYFTFAVFIGGPSAS